MKLKFDKKLIVFAVLLVLIALLFFKREGYLMSDVQKEALNKAFTDLKFKDEDRNILLKVIAESTQDGVSPIKYEKDMLRLVERYPSLGKVMISIFPIVKR
jgi:hypothetical protein